MTAVAPKANLSANTNQTAVYRRRVAVLFGGRSSEHDVSVLSATNVVKALDPDRYDVFPIFVTKAGQWRMVEPNVDLSLASTAEAAPQLCLLPGGHGRLFAVPDNATAFELPPIDVLFPVLHGMHGEDGSIQGLAEVARVPYAGCGILGSAAAIDKDVAKRLLEQAGLPVANSVCIHHAAPAPFGEVVDQLGLPLFVKPSRQGSSVGVNKVTDKESFDAALAEGFKYDRKLLAEQFIRGREIECSVLEHADGEIFVSLPGEIAPSEHHGFYSYEAKYIDENGAALIVPAQLPKDVEGRIRQAAALAFKALGCDGMARVDFFLTADMAFVVNEVNTIPGFTDISMYAKAMAVSGISYPEILDRLIDHAMARAGR
ncbi:D-alanine--D-alanine ligase family protein [Rhizobium sp. Root1220]|uniref:D-alanine--D-alanine ligase family protein n=1 Tax=Rhizobium sp. Root1220 TaxID=1736432 RepID=UPI000701D3B6|nr:D-alanine--D-alanine ligase family protein [Rhizobium sp. Root1220]KQV73342.1 D-alanine--D-alanine ligase [Rhizobium sp. Root1220]